jgi:hypothetical protein
VAVGIKKIGLPPLRGGGNKNHVSQDELEAQTNPFTASKTNPVFHRPVHLPDCCGDVFDFMAREPVEFSHSLNQSTLFQHRFHRLVHQ